MDDIKDILELIKSRRSITNYLPKPVPWEYVSRIVDAARHAPSCGNLQNWKFIVVMNPSKRKAIAEAAIQQYWMVSAPVHIIVCAEPEKAERYYGVRGERLYTVQNCAAAAQNIILEAQSLGLGTCWVGAFDEDKLKQIIRAEDFARPQSIITLGYPAEIPPRPPKHPMNVVTYFESWRGIVRDPVKYFRDYAGIWQRNIETGKSSFKNLKDKIKDKLTKKHETEVPENKPPQKREGYIQKELETEEEYNTEEQNTQQQDTQ